MKKRKNGFTLVEILAVLTILGLIALVAIPAVLNSIKSTKDDLYDNQIKLIISGAESYVTDAVTDSTVNPNIQLLMKKNITELHVSLNQLISAGALDNNISNPLCEGDNKFFEQDKVYVGITYDGAEFDYELVYKVDDDYDKDAVKTSCAAEV